MSQKIFALKGEFASRPVGSTGPYKPFFNVLSGQLSLSIETIKQKSNGNTPGTIAEDEVDREASFEVTVQARDKENIKRQLFTDAREVPASAAAVAFTLPAGVNQDVVDLGASNILTATFGALVEGVDYQLTQKTGEIVYLTTVESTPGTFTHGEYVEYGVLSAAAIENDILFTSSNSGMTYRFYRVKLSPSDVYGLVSDGNEYGSGKLSGTMLIDPTAPADPLLGKIGRVRGPK